MQYEKYTIPWGFESVGVCNNHGLRKVFAQTVSVVIYAVLMEYYSSGVSCGSLSGGGGSGGGGIKKKMSSCGGGSPSEGGTFAGGCPGM